MDNSGGDRVRGIDYIENNKADNDTYEIEKSIYKLDVTKTGKPKEDLFLGPLSLQKAAARDLLVLTTSTLPLPEYRPVQLTHKLVCSYIFSDNNAMNKISMKDQGGKMANDGIKSGSYKPDFISLFKIKLFASGLRAITASTIMVMMKPILHLTNFILLLYLNSRTLFQFFGSRF